MSPGVVRAVRRTLALALVLGALALVAPGRAWAGFIVGSGVMGGQGCASHCLLNVNAEPFAFMDKSPAGRTVTNTSVAQSAAQVKFGTRSAEYNSSSDLLSVPDSVGWAFPGDFSESVWIYATANNTSIMGQFNNGVDARPATAFRTSATNQVVATGDNTSAVNIIAPSSGVDALTQNQWSLVELIRSGSSARIYVDGRQVSNDTTSAGAILDSAGAMKLGVITGYYLAITGYRDAWTITSGGWAWSRGHTPPNRRW